MKKSNFFEGFSIIEVIISVTIFSILTPSIFLMLSYLIESSNFLSKQYLSELSKRSYLERYIINSENLIILNHSKTISTFNGFEKIKIKNKKSPNPNIRITELVSYSTLINKTIKIYQRSK